MRARTVRGYKNWLGMKRGLLAAGCGLPTKTGREISSFYNPKEEGTKHFIIPTEKECELRLNESSLSLPLHQHFFIGDQN